MAAYVMPEHDPNATLDYSVDWSDWLPSGDTISAGTWVVPTGITQAQAATATTTKCTIWLSGGTVGQTYELVNRIATAAGRVQDRTIAVPVAQR